MKQRQHGFSMVELMIAIVLSIIVIDAAVSLFMANRKTGNTTSAISNVSDSGRIAMSFISQSVRSGGYMACNATNDLHEIATGTTRQINIITPGATPVQHNYTAAFGGYEAAGSGPNNATPVPVALSPPAGAAIAGDATVGDWTGNLDAALSGKVTKGTDVLVVRESLPQAVPIYSKASYATGTGQVIIPVNSTVGISAGQFAVISDCVISTAFQIGGVAVAAGTINTAGAMDQFGGDLKWSYEFPAPITPVDMYIYFIGPGRDGDSSLWVYDELQGPPPAGFQELVPDVENMQVLYGIAPITPNQVAQYVTANNVVDFNQVVSVKVALLVASAPGAGAVQLPTAAQNFSLLYTSVAPPLDTRLRKVFDTTIAVRNAAL